ncbi:hypothetical protein [Afifella marina]|uniref:Uncharacterized protein n=1 Tax=Afifella marina DSM 2698 TaxID=1120955 RepID=A0A1G5N9R2_AFIMA|nr:hypothetical protein [Afifella marina]SCZ34112.1 hypothetical protein SAMN03080610_01638 [Afifella marina DSM 2698]
MLPKTGMTLHDGLTGRYDAAAYAAVIAAALHGELGSTHRALKTIRRWTGAGERTAVNWLAANNGPSGPHLVMLAHHSDAVLKAFLVMAAREQVVVDLDLVHARAELAAAVAAIDRLLATDKVAGSHH